MLGLVLVAYVYMCMKVFPRFWGIIHFFSSLKVRGIVFLGSYTVVSASLPVLYLCDSNFVSMSCFGTHEANLYIEYSMCMHVQLLEIKASFSLRLAVYVYNNASNYELAFTAYNK